MKNIISILTLLNLFFSSAIFAIEKADLILSSENVLLMTGQEKAIPLSIAIKDKKIAWIGSHKEGKLIKGKHINYNDQAILPGFIDAHGHASYVAFATQVANLASPPVGQVTNIKGLQIELKKYIKDLKIQPGNWVIGLGYDDSLLEEQRHPTREDLDEVSKEHPIFLIHVSSHLGAANSKGLELAEINADTKDPAGGKIRRYSDSNIPNGVVEETAAYPLQMSAMQAYKDPISSVKEAMQVYASHGITTAQDGAASIESIGLMKAANAQGNVNIDVISYPIGQIENFDALPLQNVGN